MGSLSQVKLPKLPLLGVDTILDDFTDVIKICLTSPENYERIKKLIQGFKDNFGSQVTTYLEERRKKYDNWSYDWWLEDMYTSVQLPLPVNSNPGWVFPRQCFSSGNNDVLQFTTKFILGISNYKRTLEEGTLNTDKIKSSYTSEQPLCMQQYYRLLNFYRRPGIEGDIHIDGKSSEVHETEIVIVLHKSFIFPLLIKENNKWKSSEEIFGGLNTIIETSNKLDKDNRALMSISLLTSDNRHHWAKARHLLAINETNRKQLEMIEKSLFVVCIDQLSQNTSDYHRSHQDMFRQILTGHGARRNGSNRWFDKTLQFIISSDGVNGLCYEHSAAEGVAVVNVITSILSNIKSQNNIEVNNLTFDIQSPFHWEISPEIERMIQESYSHLNNLDEDLDAEIFNFTNFGKETIKNMNYSPDAFIQMALVYTYYKLHHRLCSTYESGSTRLFLGGRVDNIRSSHVQALTWITSMDPENTNKDSQREYLRIAIEKQTNVMRNANLGKGNDIAMLGLKRASDQIAKESKVSPHELFTDPLVTALNYFELSTSQVPIDLTESYMGYGAVVPTGYGTSYNIQSQSILFVISSFRSCSTTSSLTFVEMLKDSLLAMKTLHD